MKNRPIAYFMKRTILLDIAKEYRRDQIGITLPSGYCGGVGSSTVPCVAFTLTLTTVSSPLSTSEQKNKTSGYCIFSSK